jgi:hypothetical protein
MFNRWEGLFLLTFFHFYLLFVTFFPVCNFHNVLFSGPGGPGEGGARGARGRFQGVRLDFFFTGPGEWPGKGVPGVFFFFN